MFLATAGTPRSEIKPVHFRRLLWQLPMVCDVGSEYLNFPLEGVLKFCAESIVSGFVVKLGGGLGGGVTAARDLFDIDELDATPGRLAPGAARRGPAFLDRLTDTGVCCRNQAKESMELGLLVSRGEDHPSKGL